VRVVGISRTQFGQRCELNSHVYRQCLWKMCEHGSFTPVCMLSRQMVQRMSASSSGAAIGKWSNIRSRRRYWMNLKMRSRSP
jgi:hypothetical protein